MLYYVTYTYLDLFIYLLFNIGFCLIFLGISYIVSYHNPYMEKRTGYECGFDPFSDARDPFNIKFYLISILFIIFDVEILFFFPWIFSLHLISFFGFYMMYLFVVLLIIGFLYEWRKGCLDW